MITRGYSMYVLLVQAFCLASWQVSLPVWGQTESGETAYVVDTLADRTVTCPHTKYKGYVDWDALQQDILAYGIDQREEREEESDPLPERSFIICPGTILLVPHLSPPIQVMTSMAITCGNPRE